MKLFRNIPNGIRLFRSVGIFNKHMKDIAAAREAGDNEKERELIAYWTALWVDRVIDIFDLTVNISGKENVPDNGPCVFISNHEGYGDIVVLFKALEGRQIGFYCERRIGERSLLRQMDQGNQRRLYQKRQYKRSAQVHTGWSGYTERWFFTGHIS